MGKVKHGSADASESAHTRGMLTLLRGGEANGVVDEAAERFASHSPRQRMLQREARMSCMKSKLYIALTNEYTVHVKRASG